jgi:metal-responsive CopG/Arc/MetJ family transcriptional regulator
LKVKIGLTLEPELLQEIEELRGIIKRSTFIEYLITLGLQTHRKNEAAVKISKMRQAK